MLHPHLEHESHVFENHGIAFDIVTNDVAG
jgi:hypothetical protein